MNIGGMDPQARVMIVAEIGNNHEGSAAKAEEMIGRAAEAGADAVKLQTFRTEHYVSPSDPDRFARLKALELSRQDFTRLKAVADSKGIMFLSTPLDLDSAAFLNDLVPGFKIASGDNTFYPLLEKVAGFNKPVILSTGLADLKTVRRARQTLETVWSEKGLDPGLAVLHCVCSYPVPPEQANLAAIPFLKQRLGCVTGYSDHCLGIEAAALSAAFGARIIEKHFTLDKDTPGLRDHQLSADPRDLARLVERVREIEALAGEPDKRPQPCEAACAVAVRRSIVAARDLARGQTLGPADITWVRPGGGLPPGEEPRVLGRRLLRDVPRWTMIDLKNLA
ncbi:MAG: N-acetylneuraminate synthase family protein [Desulfovibrionaceae bacterium]|nr:N-acetylneuraminate synthase family protein [Desulfovibrionaceae bacterium]